MARTAAATDADVVKALILWARSQRIAVTKLRYGMLELELADLALAAAAAPPRAPNREDADSLYRQFGGGLIDKVRRDIESDDATFEDDDENDEGPASNRREGTTSRRAPRRR